LQSLSELAHLRSSILQKLSVQREHTW
jgi:hypothetical protein